MAGFSFDFSALGAIVEDLGRISADLQQGEVAVVKEAANEYKNDVQEIIQYKTGTLRRSVHVEMTSEGGHPVALIGTNVPYARRLEYGFSDTDSLGRVYHQAPQPRWRPAWDHNHAKYERILMGVFNREEWERDIATMQYYRTELSGRI